MWEHTQTHGSTCSQREGAYDGARRSADGHGARASWRALHTVGVASRSHPDPTFKRTLRERDGSGSGVFGILSCTRRKIQAACKNPLYALEHVECRSVTVLPPPARFPKC
jgi:hypothetical protein